jgi:hypothetical protein
MSSIIVQNYYGSDAFYVLDHMGDDLEKFASKTLLMSGNGTGSDLRFPAISTSMRRSNGLKMEYETYYHNETRLVI